MRIFCSYAYTGEDKERLRDRMAALASLFRELGIDYYMNLFAPNYQSLIERNAGPGEYMREAIADMESCDIVFVVVASERRSEGLLMEVGAALMAGKKIVLAQHKSSVGKTYLDTIADHTFVWHNDNDLLKQIRERFGAKS